MHLPADYYVFSVSKNRYFGQSATRLIVIWYFGMRNWERRKMFPIFSASNHASRYKWRAAWVGVEMSLIGFWKVRENAKRTTRRNFRIVYLKKENFCWKFWLGFQKQILKNQEHWKAGENLFTESGPACVQVLNFLDGRKAAPTSFCVLGYRWRLSSLYQITKSLIFLLQIELVRQSGWKIQAEGALLL